MAIDRIEAADLATRIAELFRRDRVLDLSRIRDVIHEALEAAYSKGHRDRFLELLHAILEERRQ